MKHKFLLSAFAACTLLGLAAAPVSAQETNPYSPANGHEYRHGVLPTRDVLNQMNHWKAQHPLTAVNTATGSNTLIYGGGTSGVGVMDSHVKVYIVYYGTQWGTRTTNAKGDSVFTGDADGAISCPSTASFVPYQTGGTLAGVWYDNSKA